MKIPKLKIRPTSQQSVTRFRGVYRNPTAPIGTWYDERNLSSDLSPNLIARRERTEATGIDGNMTTAPIVAMCGGDHLVLLDADGYAWCQNGHVKIMNGAQECLVWNWTVDLSHAPNDPDVTVTPAPGRDTTFNALDGLGLNEARNAVVMSRIRIRCVSDEPPAPVWEYDAGTDGASWFSFNPASYGIEVESSGYLDKVELILDQHAEYYDLTAAKHELIRMGAYVTVWPDKLFVNAVKLASGAEMILGTDYGSLEGSITGMLGDLKLCDIDGNAYSGVVVSSVQPLVQDGYWLDTSQAEPVLRQWNYLDAAWIQISSTFVRVGPMGFSDPVFSSVKAHDTVQMVTEGEAGVDEEIRALLKGSHYIYNLIDNGDDTCDFVIAGILSSDTIHASGTQLSATRVIPSLDYVVECGNRLWGCRYDEANGINEIYASKLGDATNWEVFQGLSTDSWRASRGTAAPFTGAAVLDGHPLFFREESLEKVYPSASGAHQIQTFDLEGVENGAANSLCVIEDRLYYKSPKSVMVYTGTLPRRISDALGDLEFTGGSGARHQRKYCLSTTLKGSPDEQVVLVYDLNTGDWHLETEGWEGRAVTWRDDLYYIDEAGSIYSMAKGTGYGRVQWSAETAPQAIHYNSASQSLTEHKWISYLRLRFRFLDNGTPSDASQLSIYTSYEDGPWVLKKTYTHTGPDSQLKTWEINFLPKRKDNFRLKLEGTGPCQIYDVAWRMERSEGGH